MMGPSRPMDAPLPIERAEASALTTETTGRMIPLPVIDGVHDFRNTVPLGFRGEILH